MKYNVGDIFCRFGEQDYRAITCIDDSYVYYCWQDNSTSAIPIDILDVLVTTGSYIMINFNSEHERLAFRIKEGI